MEGPGVRHCTRSDLSVLKESGTWKADMECVFDMLARQPVSPCAVQKAMWENASADDLYLGHNVNIFFPIVVVTWGMSATTIAPKEINDYFDTSYVVHCFCGEHCSETETIFLHRPRPLAEQRDWVTTSIEVGR